VDTLAGGARGYADGLGDTAKFSFPRGLTTSPTGDAVYVADTGNNCVRVVTVSNGWTQTIAGSHAKGQKVRTSDESNLKDTGNNCVRIVTVSNGWTQTIAGSHAKGQKVRPRRHRFQWLDADYRRQPRKRPKGV
jgi:DNA-binding beta-propeller fold protein YncE